MNASHVNPLSVGTETLRGDYFRSVVAGLAPAERCDVLLVTHLMGDRPSLVEAMGQVGNVRTIVPISHSVDPQVRRQLTDAGHTVHEATASELLESGELKKLALELIDSSEARLIVCEIGGYFAEVVTELAAERPGRLAGVIEGTEAGHRRYAEMDTLPVPVLSIARSTLKETEIRLVGTSSLFSVERLLREQGLVCTGLNALVIGYGKVGAGAAEAARRRGFNVAVWDNDPTRRILALLDGFRVPARAEALSHADVIIGATGRPSLSSADFSVLKDGALLVSTSSKDVEFGDIPQHVGSTHGHISSVPRPGRPDVYLVAGGTPINFLDGAVLGHALDLIQSEMLVAMAVLASAEAEPGLREVDGESRQMLARTWLDTLTRTDGSLRFMPLERAAG